VRSTIALMQSKQGPEITDYEWPLDAGAPYEWIPGDVSVIDSYAALGHTGGTSGRWIRHREALKGAALVDGGETINIGGLPLRELADGVLTGNSVLTLGVVNAKLGDMITVTSRNTAAWTYAIANGGGGGGTLKTFASATPSWADMHFNGTNWELVRFGIL